MLNAEIVIRVDRLSQFRQDTESGRKVSAVQNSVHIDAEFNVNVVVEDLSEQQMTSCDDITFH